jgi:hypothetical protein
MEYERDALNNGVRIQTYQSDNGTFTAQAFIDELNTQEKSITSSGSGAQHQNGVAERAIKTVSESARTMMLHCALRWPDSCDPSLWPMAMQYAADIYNELPRLQGNYSPEEIFAQTKSSHSRLLNAHTWGCPTYVLEPKLRDGGKLPKWARRLDEVNSLVFRLCIPAPLA